MSQYFGAENTTAKISISIANESSTAPTSDTFPVMLFFVAFHANFVASDDGFQPVLLAEPFCDIRSELHANTALAGSAARLSLWVRPQHLHHQACLSRLLLLVAVQFSDVIQGDVVIREEAAVKHKVFVANQGSQR